MDPTDRERIAEGLNRPSRSEPTGPIVGRIVDLGHRPEDTDTGSKVYALTPLDLDYEESEGATITFTERQGTIKAADLSPIEVGGNPSVGTDAICYPVNDRWAFVRPAVKTWRYLVAGWGTGFDYDAGDGSRFHVKVYKPLDPDGNVNWNPGPGGGRPALRIDEGQLLAEGDCVDVTDQWPPHDPSIPPFGGRTDLYYKVWGEFGIPALPVAQGYVVVEITDTKGDYPAEFKVYDQFYIPGFFPPSFPVNPADPGGRNAPPTRQANWNVSKMGILVADLYTWTCPAIRWSGPAVTDVELSGGRLVQQIAYNRAGTLPGHSFAGIVGATTVAHEGIASNGSVTFLDGHSIGPIDVTITTMEPDIGETWIPYMAGLPEYLDITGGSDYLPATQHFTRSIDPGLFTPIATFEKIIPGWTTAADAPNHINQPKKLYIDLLSFGHAADGSSVDVRTLFGTQAGTTIEMDLSPPGSNALSIFIFSINHLAGNQDYQSEIIPNVHFLDSPLDIQQIVWVANWSVLGGGMLGRARAFTQFGTGDLAYQAFGGTWGVGEFACSGPAGRPDQGPLVYSGITVGTWRHGT